MPPLDPLGPRWAPVGPPLDRFIPALGCPGMAPLDPVGHYPPVPSVALLLSPCPQNWKSVPPASPYLSVLITRPSGPAPCLKNLQLLDSPHTARQSPVHPPSPVQIKSPRRKAHCDIL